jgi:pilus assembly protein CpaE
MTTDRVNAYVILDNNVNTAAVEAAIPHDERLTVAGLVEGLEGADAAVEDTTADLLVVATTGASEGLVDVIRRAVSARPSRPVVALCSNPPGYFVQSLLAAGADDVVKLPDTPERVLFAFEKAVARSRGRTVEPRLEVGPMVCILGPKGGTGKTVTASNLTVGLAKAGKRAVVVDLDLQFGDIGIALGLEPQRTVYDLASSGGALDAEKLDAYLATHSSGARALLAPIRPDQASAVTNDLLREIYGLLRSTYDVVVVDTPPDFTPEVIAAIDESSHVCMVTAMDSLSLKNTKLGLETLDLMGYERHGVSLVLNRSDSQVGITHQDVEQIIGRQPDVFVPSNREVPRSLNEGVPIVLANGRSRVAAAFRELIVMYAPNGANGDGKGRAPSRRRLGRKRKETT